MRDPLRRDRGPAEPLRTGATPAWRGRLAARRTAREQRVRERRLARQQAAGLAALATRLAVLAAPEAPAVSPPAPPPSSEPQVQIAYGYEHLVRHGPQSAGWTWLARGLAAEGQGLASLAAAAEAIRLGLWPSTLLAELAAAAGPASPAARVFQAEGLPARELSDLFRRLRAWPLRRVLRHLLLTELFARVADPEEQARLAEALADAPPAETADLARGLSEAWHRLAGGRPRHASDSTHAREVNRPGHSSPGDGPAVSGPGRARPVAANGAAGPLTAEALERLARTAEARYRGGHRGEFAGWLACRLRLEQLAGRPAASVALAMLREEGPFAGAALLDLVRTLATDTGDFTPAQWADLAGVVAGWMAPRQAPALPPRGYDELLGLLAQGAAAGQVRVWLERYDEAVAAWLAAG